MFFKVVEGFEEKDNKFKDYIDKFFSGLGVIEFKEK